MAKRLPPITEVTACPHCGSTTFYVEQTYKGPGIYHRSLIGEAGVDNSGMYDNLDIKVGKTAFCSDCHEPIAKWDEDANREAYANTPAHHYGLS